MIIKQMCLITFVYLFLQERIFFKSVKKFTLTPAIRCQAWATPALICLPAEYTFY